MDFLLTITPVRRLLITNCLLCRGEEWWVRIPIFGWSDRNFRCIIYSRFNEPRKRSKGPRGLFLIIRRTREGRVSRSPFPPLPSFLLRTSSPPLLLSSFSRASNAARFFILLLLRFLRSPRPPPRSTILYCRAAGAVLLVSSFFRLLFAGEGEARRLICLIQIVHRNGAPSVSGTVSQRFNRRTGDFKF